MWVRALLVWLLIVPLAIANGAARESFLRPRLGETWAHVASTAILSALIVLVAWLLVGWMGPQSLREALLVGVLWLGLTLAFELLAGHYLFGQPWEKLLADYDVFRGRIWVMVLIATLLAPALAYWGKRGV